MNLIPTFAANLVSLEMAGEIEHLQFENDAVHILLILPVRCRVCGAEHSWFVNRDGRTRCWECDKAYLKEREEFCAGG